MNSPGAQPNELPKEEGKERSTPTDTRTTAVRMAVIGCGNFARRQHLPNLVSMPEAVLHAVCDINPKTAQAAAEAFGAEEAMCCSTEVFADESIEAVVVAVPDDFQADIARAAVEAGKHVYLEKPGGVSESDYRSLIEARDRCGSRVAIGFNKRFAPAYAAAARTLRADGGPRNLLLRMSDDGWRWARHLPSGALLEHDACHLFDLAAWFTRRRALTVYAAAARDDDYSIVIRFEGGTVATVLISGHATMDFPKERLEAVTERGSVVVDDFVELKAFGYGPTTIPSLTFPGRASRKVDEPWVERIGNRGLAGMLDVRRTLWTLHKEHEVAEDSGGPSTSVLPNFLRDQGWYESLHAFVASVPSDRDPPNATLEDAHRTFLITDAARRSLASGQVETVNVED
ncbi:MAG: Gfo/Idh/MocA family oxidoreductase [Opitutales bacterium]|nr:Gfo/Idh/MocA family oxidoreductase [Opitutales bacterium]